MYYVIGVSVPSLHRESTDSQILRMNMYIQVIHKLCPVGMYSRFYLVYILCLAHGLRNMCHRNLPAHRSWPALANQL